MLLVAFLILFLHQSCASIDECVQGMTTTGYETLRPIELDNGKFALCDVITDGGGWIVIQRRTRGDTDFNRSINDYRHFGVGTIYTDHMLALYTVGDIIDEDHELRIDMEYNGEPYYAVYGQFELYEFRSRFTLLARHYSGTAGDSLAAVNGFDITAKDFNLYSNVQYNFDCAAKYGGAWWYRDQGCVNTNLNGQWGVHNKWNFPGGPGIPSWTEMKVRRRAYNLTHTFGMWDSVIG